MVILWRCPYFKGDKHKTYKIIKQTIIAVWDARESLYDKLHSSTSSTEVPRSMSRIIQISGGHPG
jgi:hypothetical protein